MRKKRKNKSTTQDVSLSYSGNVTIQVVRDNKVVKVIDGHNSGTIRLFDFVANCLCGLYEANNTPKYLRVFHATSEGDTDVGTKDPLTTVIPLSSALASRTSDDASTANLTFTIPGELFSGITVSPNLFALYSYNTYTIQANPLAVIYLETDITDITDDTNLILVWKLSISNKQGE